MANINFTIPDEQINRVITALCGLHPQPEGGELTDAQWCKEVIRQYIINTVKRYEQKEAIETAYAAVIVDDGIIV